MKKHVVSVFGIALALATALPFAQGASASLTASAGTYRADERAKEAGRDLYDAASIANGDIYAAVLAQDASLYKNAEDSKTAVQLKKGDALLLYYDGLHGDRSENIAVLFNNELYYAEESAFIPQGDDYPLYGCLFTSEVDFYARARKGIAVYEKAGSRGKQLGRIPANGNFAVLGRSGDSYKIAYGDGIAYISAKSPVSKINLKAWEAALQKETDAQIELGDWTYNGLLAEKRKFVNVNGISYMALPLTNGEEIREIHYRNQTLADANYKSVIDRQSLLCHTDDSGDLYEDFSEESSVYRFYRNGNTIIYYGGKDASVIAALEETHGKPFYSLKA